MGHVINPISQRLGYSRFWNSNWALSNASKNVSYSYLSTENILLTSYLKKLFLYASRRLFGKGLLLLNFKILRFSTKLTVILESRLKYLNNLHRAVEVTFWNLLGLKGYDKKKRVLSARRGSNSNERLIYKDASLNSKILDKFNTFIKKKSNSLIVIKPPYYRVKPKFLRRTSKLTRYNCRITQPDFWAYHWNSLLFSLIFKRRIVQNKKLKKNRNPLRVTLLDCCLKYFLLTRWLRLIKSILFVSLQRFYTKLPHIELLLSFISNSVLTANLVARYLATRLLQKFPIRRLLTVLIKQLKIAQNSALIHGFKIACNGRFERRGRATHTWTIIGKIPRSDPVTHVDYAIMLPVLTNSICAIKVWLTKTVSSEKPFIL